MPQGSRRRAPSTHPSMPRVQRSNNWNEVWGLVWAAAGFFLFLALVSFSARDLPSWVFFAPTARSSGPAANLIGSVGAVIAGFSYWFIGGAAFLLSVVLLGAGAVKMFVPDFQAGRRIGWLLLFLVSAACLLDLQPWFFTDWRNVFRIPGPGGWVGSALGAGLFEKNLNGVGAGIVLIAIYFIALIRMTGLRPIALFRHHMVLMKKRRAEEELRRYEEADAREKLAIEAERLARKVKEEEKRLKKKKIPIAEEPKATPTTPAAPPLETPSTQSTPSTASTKSTPPPEPTPAPEAIPVPEPEPEPAIAKAEDPDAYDWFGLGKTRKKRGKARQEETAAEAAAVAEMAKPIPVEGEYMLPGAYMLDRIDPKSLEGTPAAELEATHDLIVETLSHFGVRVHKGIYTPGPTITRYEVIPDRGVRVAKILEFERDLARATRAERINILAPIPGKETIGVELANTKKQKVTLRQLLERPEWTRSKASIPLTLGLDVYGNPIVADLAKMPHLLVAGTTGSGKSVCINAIIASIMFKFAPHELQFVMIDPKVVEMQVYNDLPHLAMPVVTEPKRVLRALSWVVGEMERRYRIFAQTNVRNITSFNSRPKKQKDAQKRDPDQAELELAAASKRAASNSEAGSLSQPEGEVVAASSDEILGPEGGAAAQAPGPIEVPRDEEIIPDNLPFIVVIIDELADLMQTAPADVEAAIARITQMARAAGIHMIVATQTPRADVITGVIKANIPSRIAFQVASKLDSRVILDANGADKLIGQGDMIYLPPGSAQQIRAQGVLVTDEEIRTLVEFCSSQKEPEFVVDLDTISDRLSGNAGSDEDGEGLTDRDRELIEKCMEIMRREKKASASMFQTRLRIGYPKAAFIMNWLEERNFVKPGQGAKHREVNFEVLGVADEQ